MALWKNKEEHKKWKADKLKGEQSEMTVKADASR